MDSAYPSGPASLFHAIAVADEPRVTIWSFCPKCMVRTEQVLEKEDELFEFYLCPRCQNLKGYAVR